MPTNALKPFEQLLSLVIPFILAAVGGIVRAVHQGRCSLSGLFVGVLTGAFVGVLMHLMMDSLPIEPGMKSAVVGMSGYAGGDLLNTLATRLCSVAKKMEVEP